MNIINTNLKKTLSLFILAAVLLSFVPIFAPLSAYAGILTNVGVLLSDAQPGATSNLTLNFTAATAVPSSGKIEISLSPFGWDVAANADALVSQNPDINGAGSGAPTFNQNGIANLGQLILPLSGNGLNAGDTVTIIIPSVRNPSWKGFHYVSTRTVNSSGTTIDGGSYGILAVISVLVGTPEVQGKVTAPDGVTPIQFSSVSARTTDYSKYGSTTTDEQGNFYVFVNAYSMYGQIASTSGVYTIEAAIYGNNPNGYTDALPITNINVTDGTTTDIGVIRLTQPNVKGKLVKNNGVTPLQWAGVSLHNSNWTVSKWASSDIDGNFLLGGVGAGSYTLEFNLPWDAKGMVPPASQTVIVIDNQVIDLGTIAYGTANKTISGQILKSTGEPVTNAKINTYKENGTGWAETVTDSNGNYTILVGSGAWNVSIYPDWSQGYGNIDWSYNDMPVKVKFTGDNSTLESKTVNFTAVASTVTVSGRVLMPGGAPLSLSGSVNAYSKNGKGSHSAVGSDGTFSFKIPAGTYDLRVYTWDNNYGSPPAATFTVTDNQIYNAGDIILLVKNEHIKGTVKDTNNNPIANQSINAWRMNGEGWANAQSGSDGSYDLLVFPGEWMVSMSLNSGMTGGYSNTSLNYIYNDPPKKIIIKANETKINNDFIVKVADATIEGTVKDENGNILTDFYGYAYISTGTTEKGYGMMGMGMGAPVSQGKFTIKVPASSYNVGVSAPPGAGYTVLDTVSADITAGGTESVTLTALTNNAIITGYFKDLNGNVVTGASGWINANNGNMAYQSTSVDTATGQYQLTVSAGDWHIGYWVNSDSYLRQSIGDNKITVVANQTVNRDLILRQADSTISGSVTGPDGASLPWVWVSVDTRSGQKAVDDTMQHMYNLGTSASASGLFSIDVPAGTYYVKAFMPLSYGYINPEEVRVKVDQNAPATVNLQFKQPDAIIAGTVFDLNNAVVEDALIWAYSDDGGYTQTFTDSNGNYSLGVTKEDEWHIGAVSETETSYAKSAEIIVGIPDNAIASKDLVLNLTGTMPEPIVATFGASNSKTITLGDGTVISIPAGALANSGDVTVTATPKAKLPAQDGAKPLSIGYDIIATDSNGAEITSTFNSNVTITLPYTDAQLTAANLNGSDLVPSYWDKTTAAWKKMDNIVLNSDNKTVSFTTNHFTEFGLVAASDATPPAVPTNIVVTNPAVGGQLNLSWTNPTDADFSSVNIYRSTVSGTLGAKVYSNVTGTAKADTELTDGTTYYYTIRSVDTVGNESVNTVQISGVPTTAGSAVQNPGTSEELVNIKPGDGSITYFSIYPNGSLITSPGTGSVYLLEDGKKRPFSSAAIFDANGYKWKNIIVVQDSELNLYVIGASISTYPNGTLIKGSDNKIYLVTDGKKSYITGPSVFVGLGYNWSDVISVSDAHLTLYVDNSDISGTSNHVNGTLIKTVNGGSVYLLENGKKRGIASPQIFEARGHKWNRIVSITQTELDTYADGDLIAVYPDGTLLKDNSSFKVYLISGGKKRLIPSPIFFEDMGYKWSNVIEVNLSHLNLYTAAAEVKSNKFHPNGTLVKANGGNSVYLIEQGKKRPVASAVVFDANGYNWNEVVTVKRSELEMYGDGAAVETYPNGTLLKGPDGKVYVIDGAVKRYITGPEVFQKLGYQWNNIISVSSAHLGLYFTSDDLVNANVRPSGTLIQGPDKTNVYLIEFGLKRLITSPVIFQRRGFKWSNIVSVSEQELAQYSNYTHINTYPPTSLLKDQNGRVYLVSNGKKLWFSGPKVFEDLGYNWNNLISVANAELFNYIDGNNIQ